MNNNLDWGNIKTKVKEIAKKYIQYCLLIDINSTSKISEDYTLKELDSDNISNYTKLNRVELEKRVSKINSFRIAFNKLTTEERKIIYWTYLDKEDSYDDRFIANSLGFSLGYYYIKKKETLIRFAYALGIEVL